MSGQKPPRPRPRPRPKGFDDVPELSDEEVERRVDVRGGAAPRGPVERAPRVPRAPRRKERTVARDSLLLIGLVIVGLVAVRVFLPDGPLSASATNAPSGTQAVVALIPATSNGQTPGLQTLVPVITLPPGTVLPTALVEPTAPPPTPTLAPGQTPKPTPKPTSKPTAVPTSVPTPGPTQPNRATVVVIMHVVNNNGASASAADWHMVMSGEAATGASANNFTGSESPGRSVSIVAGKGYSVTDDSSQSGYATRTRSADCTRPAGVGLAAGTTFTCTITRNDRPQLLVITNVTNDDTGTATASDWAVTITAQQASPTSFDGSDGGVTVTLGAGLAYSVQMSGPSGYTQTSRSAVCTGDIGVDEPNETCTISFDDDAAPPAPAGPLPLLFLPLFRPRRWRTTTTG